MNKGCYGISTRGRHRLDQETGWLPLAPYLVNAIQYSSTGTTPIAFRRDSNGVVWFTGEIFTGSNPQFIMPFGFRPSMRWEGILSRGNTTDISEVLADGSYNAGGSGVVISLMPIIYSTKPILVKGP